MNVFLVFSTAPDRATARRIVRVVLEKRLAACVHLSASGESHYWWKGGLEHARETAMLFKTSKKALPSLMQTIKQLHPYEIPEILAVRVEEGHPAYLKWLQNESHPED